MRETCDRVLEDTTVSRSKATLRAIALQIIGEAYMTVKKESDNNAPDESEYVRVDTRTSRERDRQRAA